MEAKVVEAAKRWLEAKEQCAAPSGYGPKMQEAERSLVEAVHALKTYEKQVKQMIDSENPESLHPACREVKGGGQCSGLLNHASKHWSPISGPWEQGESDSNDGPILWRD